MLEAEAEEAEVGEIVAEAEAAGAASLAGREPFGNENGTGDCHTGMEEDDIEAPTGA